MLKRYAWITISVWTVVIAGLMITKIIDTQNVTRRMAINETRTHHNREMSVRLWGASHGGVYVPVDDDTPPNPYLSHIPNRDIKVSSDKTLTLMSPAYMLRQMAERFNQQYGIFGHITRLNPVRPENVADNWEKMALARFDNGEQEILDFSDIQGSPYLRFMRPLKIVEDCLKCHTYKTRKIGDVGGGVSISVPMAPYLKNQKKEIIFISSSFGLLWILGSIGIFFGFSGLTKRIRERNLAQEHLKKAQDDLIEQQKDALELQTRMTEAFARFVPQEFFEHLNKTSVLDINLGDQTLKEMTILFSDIRAFTSISEGMTPQENFMFINSYLKEVGPIIRSHNGFIDKYIGDAIMALFPRNAEDALKTAIDMQRQIVKFNDSQDRESKEPIAIGIGLHTGNLMLGTIGEENRMETTVISDSVNLASRMEGLTKLYGSKICVSNQFFDHIKNKDRYSYRYLDKVKVKGKKEAISVFEILDGLLPKDFELKLATRATFQTAIELYQQGSLSEAMEKFKTAFEVNQDDTACLVYMKRCEKLMAGGVPDGWDGVEKLDAK